MQASWSSEACAERRRGPSGAPETRERGGSSRREAWGPGRREGARPGEAGQAPGKRARTRPGRGRAGPSAWGERAGGGPGVEEVSGAGGVGGSREAGEAGCPSGLSPVSSPRVWAAAAVVVGLEVRAVLRVAHVGVGGERRWL